MKERGGRAGRAAAAWTRTAKLIAQEVGSAVEDVFNPAEETDLESLEQLGMPESVMAFYREYAPVETIELHDVRLWDIPHLLDENHTYQPGADIHDLGYVVVAGNRSGDVFCLDLGEWKNEDPPRVVLLPHSVQIGSHDRTVVDEQAQAVADSFDEFLGMFARGEAKV